VNQMMLLLAKARRTFVLAGLPHTSDAAAAAAAVRQFVTDVDEGVREAAAEVAATLRIASCNHTEPFWLIL